MKNQDSFIDKEELIRVFSDCIETKKVIEFKLNWVFPPDKIDDVIFSPYLISKTVLGKTLTYGYDHNKKEFSTHLLGRILSYHFTDTEFYKEGSLVKYRIDYADDEEIIKAIPELKFDHSMKSLAFKLKPEEKKRQDEIYKILSECIDSYKIVLLHLVWANQKKEKVLFEPFLLGEDYSLSSRGLFLYGMNIIDGKDRIFSLKFVKVVEIGVNSYSLNNKIIEYFPYNSVVKKKIQELKILEHFHDQTQKETSPAVTQWIEPDYVKKPCIICGSAESCEHTTFLITHYKEEKSRWEESNNYTQLLNETIKHHPGFFVHPYFTKNKQGLKRFSQIKRKKWDKTYFRLIGEWSQSPVHSGNLIFDIKSTHDKKYWAIFQKGFPTRIYAVAEIIDDGDVVMEKVAGGMMFCFTFYEGVYIECKYTLGEVNCSLLYDLYEYYIDKFKKED